MIQHLNELLNILKIDSVICEEYVSTVLEHPYNFRIVKDVRSATFEALGISKMKDDRVALIVDERYLSSIYTGITEAWFQRTNILIVTYNANLYQSLEYIDRCIVGKALLLDSSEVGILARVIKMKNGPFFLRSSITLDNDNPIDYISINRVLNEVVTENDTVFYYNPIGKVMENKANVQTIKPEHKYCVISKYLGFILGRPACKCILCIPETLLVYDSNVFNFRNIPNNFCIIIYSDASGLMERFRPWIVSNNISLNVVNSNKFGLSGKKEIIYLKNGELCIHI